MGWRGNERKGGKKKTYSHGQQPWLIMLEREVLIGERLGPVDARATCSVAVEEVAALTHEVGDLTKKVSN